MSNMKWTELEFREEVSPSDCEAVSRIVASSGFFSAEEVDVAVELVTERLEKGIRSGYHFLVAEFSGRVAGYTCFGPIPCTKTSYDLYWIVVDAELRGLSLGKDLLARSEAIVAGLGGRRLYIETSSRELYEPTRHFYEGRRYSRAAVLENFYSEGDHKIIYVKDLERGSCSG